MPVPFRWARADRIAHACRVPRRRVGREAYRHRPSARPSTRRRARDAAVVKDGGGGCKPLGVGGAVAAERLQPLVTLAPSHTRPPVFRGGVGIEHEAGMRGQPRLGLACRASLAGPYLCPAPLAARLGGMRAALPSLERVPSCDDGSLKEEEESPERVAASEARVANNGTGRQTAPPRVEQGAFPSSDQKQARWRPARVRVRVQVRVRVPFGAGSQRDGDPRGKSSDAPLLQSQRRRRRSPRRSPPRASHWRHRTPSAARGGRASPTWYLP